MSREYCMKPSEHFLEETAFTHKYIIAKGHRLEWIDWKKNGTAKVARIYKDKEAFLNSNPHPKASYFKGIIHIKKGRGKAPSEMKYPFSKSTQGTDSKLYKIITRNVKKNH